MLCLSVGFDLFQKVRVDARRWSIRVEHMHYCDFSNTLEGMTVAWIECDDAIFNAILRWSTPQIVLSRNKSASKVAN